jgi:pseudaminic acid biosynthesis-associated methylase
MDEQELFWKGNFGDEYTNRNNEEKIFISKKNFFKNLLNKINISNVLELGCNRGLNLLAINELNKEIELNGLEINTKSYEILKNKNVCNNLFNISINDFNSDKNYNLVFTFGVLIHLNPEKLDSVYEKIFNLSDKYILIAEYYSRNTTMIEYRNNTDKLFKRDFCGEIMKKYNQLKLIDYGFIYYNDPIYPLDDITWFLLEK